MENVVLTIHLIIAVFLIGVVLLQRSEGGALGIGGGGGGMVTGRGAATALSKVTWGLAIAFIATSLTLTVLAAQRSAEESVLDRIRTAPGTETIVPGAETPPSLLVPPPPADSAPPADSTAPNAPLAPLAPPPAN
jgi:preprotein translocase subunit SecG